MTHNEHARHLYRQMMSRVRPQPDDTQLEQDLGKLLMRLDADDQNERLRGISLTYNQFNDASILVDDADTDVLGLDRDL